MENNIPKDENYIGEGQINAPKNDDKQPQKVEIEINKYKNLVRALNEPKMLAKVIMVTTMIVILVFLGISLIALMIKNFYPYKAINSNEYGATFIENEDSEVIYWLFNSADLWANTGIEVHKGDVLTIHTSGAFHSAVHHLVDDAKNNRITFNWMEANGGFPNKDPREEERSEHRIVKKYTNNTILMQVLPIDIEKKEGINKKWWKNCCDDTEKLDCIDGMYGRARIYAIGKDIENLEIQEDGILSFSINEVAFTRRNIREMYKKIHYKYKDDIITVGLGNDNRIENGLSIHKGDIVKIVKNDTTNQIQIKRSDIKDVSPLGIGKYPTPEYAGDLLLLYDNIDSIYNLHRISDSMNDSINTSEGIDSIKNILRDLKNLINQNNLTKELVPFKQGKRLKEITDTSINEKINEVKRLIWKYLNELDYYYITDFVDAWCVDNVGSFLIVIERKSK